MGWWRGSTITLKTMAGGISVWRRNLENYCGWMGCQSGLEMRDKVLVQFRLCMSGEHRHLESPFKSHYQFKGFFCHLGILAGTKEYQKVIPRNNLTQEIYWQRCFMATASEQEERQQRAGWKGGGFNRVLENMQWASGKVQLGWLLSCSPPPPILLSHMGVYF